MDWLRHLGARGPRVSALGLGLAALGRPGYLNVGHGDDIGPDHSVEAMRARCFEVLDAAREEGIVYFDAARSYGRAEEFLGAWLGERGIEPGELTIGSKWGYAYTADWQVDADPPEVKDLSLAQFERQIEETRGFLGDHLTVYQIHSATIESGVLEDAAVLDALERAARDRRPDRAVDVRRRSGLGDRSRGVARACSTRCRRPGTCSSRRPARPSRVPPRPAWA